MNLILLTPQDCPQTDTAILTGRRLQHVLSVHQAQVGQTLRVGMMNGQMGEGEIILDEQALHRFQLTVKTKRELQWIILRLQCHQKGSPLYASPYCLSA